MGFEVGQALTLGAVVLRDSSGETVGRRPVRRPLEQSREMRWWPGSGWWWRWGGGYTWDLFEGRAKDSSVQSMWRLEELHPGWLLGCLSWRLACG